MPPRLLGDRYELDGVVGRGGLAEVFRARDFRLDRVVAVKTLRDDLAGDKISQARFRREAQSAASLNHPSIVAVYDTGEDMGGPTAGPSREARSAAAFELPPKKEPQRLKRAAVVVPYIVMEFVDGRALGDLLRDDRRLLPERVMEITDGVLEALEYSHRNGILHRDIKPGNVMLTRTGKVKVMDFRIARAVSDDYIGTARYFSPEQARGERVDARSDLYSTGCLLYELLTGRPPFTGNSPVAIAFQHVREQPVPPSRVDPEIPGWADAIVLRAMAKDPSDRYQSAGEMRGDIKRALTAVPVIAPPRGDLTPAPLKPGSSWTYNPPAVVSAPVPVVLKHPTVVRVTEAARRSEPLHKEVRRFNNKKSSVTTEETIRVSYTARVSTLVDLSETRALSGNARVGFANIVGAQASLGNDLMRHYSLGISDELTYEQTTKITVPAHKKVMLTLHWVRIWAKGMITLSERTRRAVDEVAEVPYEITVALAYDPETRDI